MMPARARLLSTFLVLGFVALLMLFPQFCRRLTLLTDEAHYFIESERVEQENRIAFIDTSFARFKKLDSLGGRFRFASTLPDSAQQRQAREAIAAYREAGQLMEGIIHAIPTVDTNDNYSYQRARLLREFCRSKISMIDPAQSNTERFRYAMQVDSIRKAYHLLRAQNTHSSMQ